MISGAVEHRKVALRLVPFIAHHTPRDLLRLLAFPTYEGDDSLFVYTAYELTDTESEYPRVNPETFSRILDTTADASRREETTDEFHFYLSLISPRFFVWRDDFEQSYWYFKELTLPREEWDSSDVPNWNPSVHPYDELINECPEDLRPTDHVQRPGVEGRKTGIRIAIENAYESYKARFGAEPPNYRVFRDFLCENDGTGFIADREDDRLIWANRSGGLSETGDKAFENLYSKVRQGTD